MNWGPLSEWVLDFLILVSEIYYAVDHWRSKKEKYTCKCSHQQMKQ